MSKCQPFTTKIMKLGTQGDYVIISTPDEPKHYIEAMADSGQLVYGKVDFHDSDLTPQKEAAQIAQQHIKETTSFERTRAPFRDALRAIMGFVFDEYQLPRDGGVDFGSGATGEMVHQLLRDRIHPSTWAEVEVNPAAIAENKRRHPQAVIIQGSYHDTSALGLHNTLNIATGLSTLDATQFVPEAVAQIADTIRPGGYLLHVQDVRPGLGTANRELRTLGLKPPFESFNLAAKPSEVIAYSTPIGPMSVGELFRRNLGRAIEEQPDLQLLMNDWVVAKKQIDEAYGRTYYMNINMATSDKIEEAYAVVTLAQKKA